MAAPRPIAVFEPDPIRQQQIRSVVDSWQGGFRLRYWNCAEEFQNDLPGFLPRVALIILADDAPLQAWLSNLEPVCPVICATAYLMKAGGWPVVTQLAPPPELHSGLESMRRSLMGLAIGDSIGEMLSYGAHRAPDRMQEPDFPAAPLYHTDDSEMALALCSILRAHRTVHQDALGARFARRFLLDPDRGYGKMTRIQLREMLDGADWRKLSKSAFGGQGSMGNGSAMRVAPLAAFFADDLDLCIEQARASSEVTHAHPEAIAGSIAVAVAAALACRTSSIALPEVVKHVPESEVRRRLEQAQHLSGTHLEAARLLGCGAQVTSQDTVPFCLWLAATSTNYPEAIGRAIQADGDCDTCAAITGALVALTAPDTIPQRWARSLESAFRA
jgi:ADP-ribosylglycohydrolase